MENQGKEVEVRNCSTIVNLRQGIASSCGKDALQVTVIRETEFMLKRIRGSTY